MQKWLGSGLHWVIHVNNVNQLSSYDHIGTAWCFEPSGEELSISFGISWSNRRAMRSASGESGFDLVTNVRLCDVAGGKRQQGGHMRAMCWTSVVCQTCHCISQWSHRLFMQSFLCLWDTNINISLMSEESNRVEVRTWGLRACKMSVYLSNTSVQQIQIQLELRVKVIGTHQEAAHYDSWCIKRTG